MKKFNKTITVEVEVDSIANKLLDTLDPKNPHRELIASVIIENSLENGGLSIIYNALHGFSTELDVEVGKEYSVKREYLITYRADENQNYITVKVLAINLFKTDGSYIKISYNYLNKTGGTITDDMWINHKYLETHHLNFPKTVESVVETDLIP